MRGLRLTIAVGVAVVLGTVPVGAASRGSRDGGDDSVLRKYIVTYSGKWHQEGSFESTDGPVHFTDDGQWDLRSKGPKIEIVTSRKHNFGSVTGGVVAAEMRGFAVTTRTYTDSKGTETFTDDGPDVIEASLDDDEGTDKQHELGAASPEYARYGNDPNVDIYPMAIDGRHPRKGFSHKISGSNSFSSQDEQYTSSIDATWSLELTKKKRLD